MGLGSNLGDPEDNINQALSRMEALGEDVRFVAVSEAYQTEPQLKKDQPWFVNQVAHFEVDPEIWAPEGFLSSLMSVEDQMFRERGEENGPRIIDLDLLLFGDVVQATGYLDLPHPRMRERAFVLVPLKDVAPDLVFPDGVTIDQALAQVEHRIEDGKIWQE